MIRLNGPSNAVECDTEAKPRNESAERRRLIVVTGPTASGKTELAHRLALEVDAELINADSVQIYRHMNIGSGKPSPELRRERTYHLIDVRDPDEPMDAQTYRSLARAAIRETRDRGKVPIVVGGTGFYIRALLRGLFDGPGRDTHARRRLEARMAAEGRQALHEALANVDPAAAARIHPHDSYRIIRALEVWETTGRTITDWQDRHRFLDTPYDARLFVLSLPLDEIRRKINSRVEEMIHTGWQEEVGGLLDRGYDERHRPMRSIGYRQLIDVCRETLPLEDATERIKKETYDFAKRQLTWFRKEPAAHWVSPDTPDHFRTAALSFLESRDATVSPV